MAPVLSPGEHHLWLGQCLNQEGNIRRTKTPSPPVIVNASSEQQIAAPALAGLWCTSQVSLRYMCKWGTATTAWSASFLLFSLAFSISFCPQVPTVWADLMLVIVLLWVGGETELGDLQRSLPSSMLSVFSFRGGLNCYQPELVITFSSFSFNFRPEEGLMCQKSYFPNYTHWCKKWISPCLQTSSWECFLSTVTGA